MIINIQIILECVNAELGYTDDLAKVWSFDDSRQAWVFIQNGLENSSPFIAGIVLIEPLKKACLIIVFHFIYIYISLKKRLPSLYYHNIV